MSARVFNPAVLSEMRRMISRSSSDPSGTPAAVAIVRRDLFGPVNHEDSQVFVDKELAAIRNRDSERWGFDFVKETPLDNSRYLWERVTPEESIPQAYAMRRLSFMEKKSKSIQITDASTTPTTSTKNTQDTTSPKSKRGGKQSQMTDFLKCRKRSMSAGEISSRKAGSAGGISSRKVGTARTSLSEPAKRKRSKTRQ